MVQPLGSKQERIREINKISAERSIALRLTDDTFDARALHTERTIGGVDEFGHVAGHALARFVAD